MAGERRAPCLDPLHAIERVSIDELRATQLERLQETLYHVYKNSPVYRRKFDAAGVHPGDVREIGDIVKLPFTTKQDLRDNYPFGMFAIPMGSVSRIHASSGTTGKQTVVGYSAADIDMWADVVARSIRAAGGKAGDKVHVAYGYGLFTGGLGAHYGAEKLGCTVIPMSGGQTEKQVQLIRDFDPDIILVTPSYMLSLADEMDRQGVDPARLALRVGIFGAEPWSDAMREELERRLHIDAVDIYGLSEVIGPGVAQECVESKDGPTIWEDHFYPEVIDPVTSEPLPDGEEGELVFTSLTKEAMPVIRYRTRDLTQLLPGTDRTMRRMARIMGRTDDMMIVRGVNVYPSQIEERLLTIDAFAPFYYVELRKDGPLDILIVHTEIIGNLEKSEPVGRLKQQIKSYIGISVEVHVHETGSIPRSEGKAKRIVDNR